MPKRWRKIARRSRWSRVCCSSRKIETQRSQGVKELEAIRQEVQMVKSLLLSRNDRDPGEPGCQRAGDHSPGGPEGQESPVQQVR